MVRRENCYVFLEYANMYADEDENVITIKDLDKGREKNLAAQSSQS
ncbi:MAG: hypothetical protein U5L45_00965 [Saprospiraceae bacterium]|nr:hypothetical protein [Saprospiraceae bacterium]